MLLGLGRRQAVSDNAATAEDAGAITHEAYLARGFMPELDGLRALSILAVITAHMHTDIWNWLDGGRGVALFFILSGFLITRLCLLEEAKTGGVSFKAFYIRRGFRLLPAYYTVLAVYCLLILVLGFNPEKKDLLVGALPFFFLYLSEIPGILGVHGQVVDVPFGQSWSLGIEEKFYLIFPMLIFGLLRFSRRLRIPITLSLGLFFMATLFFGVGDIALLFFPYSNILLGCLLAMLLQDPKVFAMLRPLATPRWTLALLLVFLVVQFSHPDNLHIDSGLYVHSIPSIYAIVATFLFASVILGTGWLPRALGWAPLAFVGRISYGIYLVHRLCLNPVEDFLGAADGGVAINVLSYFVACAVSIAGAYIMYRVLERPLNRFGHGWSRRIQTSSNERLAATPKSA
jgi:peptidoglycan/LPS O-acetylase OafA/YrhL